MLEPTPTPDRGPPRSELKGLWAPDARTEAIACITRSAGRLLRVPMTFIALEGGGIESISGCQGIQAEAAASIHQNCPDIASGRPVAVEDAASDPQWRQHPLVAGPPGIGALFATPLWLADGRQAGTLWMLDRAPRVLQEEDQAAMRDLATMAQCALATLRSGETATAAESNGRKLRESALLLQSVMDSTSSYVHVRDLNGRYLYVNKEYERVFGLSQHELIGKTIEDAFTPALAHKYRSAEQYVIESRKVLRTEAVVEQDDGPHTYLVVRSPLVDESGTVYGACGVGTDITQRIHDANELRELNRQLSAATAVQQAILNSATCAIVATGIDGIIRIFSAGAERMLGYSASEVIGQRTPAVFHTDQELDARAQELSAELDREIAAGFEVFICKTLDGDADEHEWTYIRKDGSRLPVMLSVTALWDEQQHITGFLSIAYDLTERKKVENMKSEFISNVSHELRTPLTSIRGSLGLLSAGKMGTLPRAARAMLDIASSNCERLVRLINDILDIEKIETGHMRFELVRQPLLPLVGHAVAVMQAYADQFQVRMALSGAADLWVMADADRLIQVIVNLLSNAIKFSETAGQVEIGLVRDGDCARLSVTDHGSGIPPEFRDRIFEKFAQADSSDARRKGGTGLGLSISRAIVERHKGRIEFESEPGRCTRFTVDLPLAEDIPASAPGIASGRVLVCEGEADTAEQLQLLLSQGGFSADIAADARQARALLEQEHYDAVTLDLMLPGEEGASLLGWLRSREETRTLPVVVVTGQPGQDHAGLDAAGFGIAGWLDRPIDEEGLLAALRSAIGRAGQRPLCILQINADPHLTDVVKSALPDQHEVDHADSLAAARSYLAKRRYDLILLDLSLDHEAGAQLLASRPAPNLHTPVVIFSAGESDPSVCNKVRAALARSHTSNSQLLDTLHHLIGRNTPTAYQGKHHDSRPD